MPVVVPISPEKLLDAARALAGKGRGRPRSMFLRRAISSAYYALFHAISLQAMAHVASNCSQEEQLLLARSVSHDAISSVCQWIARGNKGPAHAAALADSLRGTPIDYVANIFLDLQEQRHAVDYDHLAQVSKPSAVAAIGDAEEAIVRLNRAGQRDREAFFSLIALKTTIK